MRRWRGAAGDNRYTNAYLAHTCTNDGRRGLSARSVGAVCRGGRRCARTHAKTADTRYPLCACRYPDDVPPAWRCARPTVAGDDVVPPAWQVSPSATVHRRPCHVYPARLPPMMTSCRRVMRRRPYAAYPVRCPFGSRPRTIYMSPVHGVCGGSTACRAGRHEQAAMSSPPHQKRRRAPTRYTRPRMPRLGAS